MQVQSNELQNLENFICDNQELERLESMFKRFNIFDSLKLANNEIRHSNFLAWLINPKETHGLDDYFLKELVKKSIYENSEIIQEYRSKYTIPTLFDVDGWDFSNVEVRREYKNIDLLIIDEFNKFVLVIENKIWSEQHDDQLLRYRKIIDDAYSNDYKKLFLYLKPEKEEIEAPYIYISYSNINDTIEKLFTNKADKISKEILYFIRDYKSMIERNIMKEAEIKQICQTIYNNHKTALDVIFENISSPTNEIADILREIIEEDSRLCLNDTIGSSSQIRFWLKDLYLDELKISPNWTPSAQVILFEFMNNKDKLTLNVTIGNVEPKNQAIKDKLCDLISREFPNARKFRKTTNYIAAICETLIHSNDYSKIVNQEKEEVKKYIKAQINKTGLIEKLGNVISQNFKAVRV